MDLRMVKTQNAIYAAYVSLRRKHPPEKIKVVDICKLAQINKSTFYKHYHDVFELTDKLTQETIDRFWDAFDDKGLMLSQPAEFLIRLPKAVDGLGSNVLSAFFQGGSEKFFDCLEKKLSEYYISHSDSSGDKLKKSFIICGVIHVLKQQKENRLYDNTLMAEEAEGIILALKALELQ